MKKLPKLPKSIATIFGPMPIGVLSAERATELEALGLIDFINRRIDIVATGSQVCRWQYFWHEVVHAALWDSGVHNVINEQQHEAIADAIGAFLAQMVQAGQLKVSDTWEKDQSAGSKKTRKR